MTTDIRDMSFSDVRKHWLKKGAETFKWRNRKFDTQTGKELIATPKVELVEDKPKRGRPKKEKVDVEE